LIRLQAGTYELVEEHRNGWNPEAFKERYSDILDKYDYIVGDWGYGQLRLRGFFENSNRKVPFEQKIATLDEYIHEFCNFGCAYFVLKRTKPTAEMPESPNELQEMPQESAASMGESAESQPRAEYTRYPRRNDRQERQPFPRQDGKEKGERSGRSEKNGRYPRHAGERSQRNEQALKEKRNGHQQHNRPQRDKVSTNTASELPRNSGKS